MKVLTVLINNKKYAIDIKYVKGIEQNVKISPMSCISKKWIGMTNIRDELIKIYNPFDLFTYNISEEQILKNKMVIIDSDQLFGLIIDDALSVFEVENEMLKEMPDILNIDFINKVIRIDNDLIPILDVKKI